MQAKDTQFENFGFCFFLDSEQSRFVKNAKRIHLLMNHNYLISFIFVFISSIGLAYILNLTFAYQLPLGAVRYMYSNASPFLIFIAGMQVTVISVLVPVSLSVISRLVESQKSAEHKMQSFIVFSGVKLLVTSSAGLTLISLIVFFAMAGLSHEAVVSLMLSALFWVGLNMVLLLIMIKRTIVFFNPGYSYYAAVTYYYNFVVLKCIYREQVKERTTPKARYLFGRYHLRSTRFPDSVWRDFSFILLGDAFDSLIKKDSSGFKIVLEKTKKSMLKLNLQKYEDEIRGERKLVAEYVPDGAWSLSFYDEFIRVLQRLAYRTIADTEYEVIEFKWLSGLYQNMVDMRPLSSDMRDEQIELLAKQLRNHRMLWGVLCSPGLVSRFSERSGTLNDLSRVFISKWGVNLMLAKASSNGANNSLYSFKHMYFIETLKILSVSLSVNQKCLHEWAVDAFIYTGSLRPKFHDILSSGGVKEHIMTSGKALPLDKNESLNALSNLYSDLAVIAMAKLASSRLPKKNKSKALELIESIFRARSPIKSEAGRITTPVFTNSSEMVINVLRMSSCFEEGDEYERYIGKITESFDSFSSEDISLELRSYSSIRESHIDVDILTFVASFMIYKRGLALPMLRLNRVESISKAKVKRVFQLLVSDYQAVKNLSLSVFDIEEKVFEESWLCLCEQVKNAKVELT